MYCFVGEDGKKKENKQSKLLDQNLYKWKKKTVWNHGKVTFERG